MRSSSGTYPVVIGAGAFDAAMDSGSFDVVLADDYFAEHFAEAPLPVLVVPADEDHKSLGYAEELVLGLQGVGARRDSTLLAVGGGVVQDLATFVASIYMRGIPWHYAPTTLASMADSCIGGKSSINAGGVKNLVGNYFPPAGITVDPRFLVTLSTEEVVAGLSEAAKICYCGGPDRFARYLEFHTAFRRDPEAAAPLLHHVLSTKAWFIEVDEHDRRERRQLNFGHTFGHALEAASSHAIPHGVGVALGMLCAVRFAERWGHEARADPTLVGHCHELLDQVVGLPAEVAAVDLAGFERAFRADKKHTRDSWRLLLPAASGGVEEVALPVSDAVLGAVLEAVETTLVEAA